MEVHRMEVGSLRTPPNVGEGHSKALSVPSKRKIGDKSGDVGDFSGRSRISRSKTVSWAGKSNGERIVRSSPVRWRGQSRKAEIESSVSMVSTNQRPLSVRRE